MIAFKIIRGFLQIGAEKWAIVAKMPQLTSQPLDADLMPVRCTKLMEKVSTTYKLTDGVLVTVMHIIKQRDRTCRY